MSSFHTQFVQPQKYSSTRERDRAALERRLALPLDEGVWDHALRLLRLPSVRPTATGDDYRRVMVCYLRHTAAHRTEGLVGCRALMASGTVPTSVSLYTTVAGGFAARGLPEEALETAREGQLHRPWAPATRRDLAHRILEACASKGLYGTAMDTARDLLPPNERQAGAAQRLLGEAAAAAGRWDSALTHAPLGDLSPRAAASVGVAAGMAMRWDVALACAARCPTSGLLDRACLNALGACGRWESAVRFAAGMASRHRSLDGTAVALLMACLGREAPPTGATVFRSLMRASDLDVEVTPTAAGFAAQCFARSGSWEQALGLLTPRVGQDPARVVPALRAAVLATTDAAPPEVRGTVVDLFRSALRLDAHPQPGERSLWAAEVSQRAATPSVRPSRAAYFPARRHATVTDAAPAEVPAEGAAPAFDGDPFQDPAPKPVGWHDEANGYNYFNRGGLKVWPGSRVVGSTLSMRPKTMRRLNDPNRSWRDSTSHAHRKVARYRVGSSV